MPADASPPTADEPLRVVIVGAGVAGLEAALALDALAGGRVRVELLAPEESFAYRPLEVREPFAGPSAPRYDLAQLLDSTPTTLRAGTLAGVDPVGRVAWTTGAESLEYDALILGLGAVPDRKRAHVRLLQPSKLDDVLHGFVQDVEGGYVKSAAFLVPDRVGWPLPLYELLLMTAERADAMWSQIALTLITSEPAPLERFGREASDEVVARLDEAGVEVVTGAHADVPAQGTVEISHAGGRRELTVDSVIALPELHGPEIKGLPADEHGFVAVDAFGRVVGVDRIFAAGDMTTLPVKLGGAAAGMAEVVAAGVAALAGADVTPEPLSYEPSGLLLTGGLPVALGRSPERGDARTAATGQPIKIAAPRLEARLAAIGHRPPVEAS